MKRLRRIYLLIKLSIAVNVALLVFSLLASAFYFQHFHELKNAIHYQVNQEKLKALHDLTVKEILATPDLRLQMQSVLANSSGDGASISTMAQKVEAMEMYFYLFALGFLFSLVILAFLYFYLQRKWKKILDQEIKKYIHLAAEISAKHASGMAWTEDLILAILELQNWERYKPLVCLYFE